MVLVGFVTMGFLQPAIAHPFENHYYKTVHLNEEFAAGNCSYSQYDPEYLTMIKQAVGVEDVIGYFPSKEARRNHYNK